MAATARTYTIADIARGPVDIWLNVAAPAFGAEVAIDTTSGVHTPESSANPSALHLGLSKEGASLLIKPATENFMADELTSPYRSAISDEEVVISTKGSLQVGQNMTILAQLVLGSTASTPTGKLALKGGGLSTITYRTVMAIWALPEDTTKYMYWLLYRSYNDTGVALEISRKIDASADIAFRGFSDPARTAGDQIYQIIKKT